MKKNKLIPLIILAVLLVLLIVAYALLDSRNEKKAAESADATESETPAITVCAFSPDSVTEISYKSENVDVTVAKSGNVWIIPDDEKFPVDQTAVSKMLSSVAALSASRKLEGADPATYGLDKPVLTITLTVGGESQVLTVGSVNSYNDMTYLGYGDNVFMISDTLSDNFKKTKNELFGKGDTFPAEITEDSVTAVILTNEKGEEGTVSDADGLSDLVYDLQKYISFSIPKGYGLDTDGLASYGIGADSPRIVVEYTHSSAKATFEIFLGKDSEGKCYYALSSGDVTYGIDVTGYDKLLNYVYHTPVSDTTQSE